MGGEDDDDIGFLGAGGGEGRIGAVVEGDMGAGRARRDRLHRRAGHQQHRLPVVGGIGGGNGQRRARLRRHLGRAAARHHADIGIAADHRDALGGLEQGQDAVVLQQHRAGGGFGPRRRFAARDVGRADLGGIVEQMAGEHGAQDALVHVGDARGIGGVLAVQRRQRRAEEDLAVEFLARFPVQSRQRVGGGMIGAPVRHHKAGIMPVLLQHLVEQEVAAAGKGPVEVVVGAHHRAGIAALDGDLEGQQVAFARRGFGDVHADGALLGLLGVQRIMLDGGHHMLVLDAADGFARQRAGQQRVFAQIFEIAAIARLARQVDAAGQQHIQAAGARILGDGRAAVIGDLRVPAGRQRQAGGQGGGVLARACR